MSAPSLRQASNHCEWISGLCDGVPSTDRRAIHHGSPASSRISSLGQRVYVLSIVAEIGAAIEQHLKTIGLIRAPEMDESAKRLMLRSGAGNSVAKQGNAETAKPAAEPPIGFSPRATPCK